MNNGDKSKTLAFFVKQPWAIHSLLTGYPHRIDEADSVRFWQLVQQSESDECWPWRGVVRKAGYGNFPLNGTHVHPHQFALYDSGRDPATPDLEIDHLCNNPCCMNPDHLEWVTHAENMRRGSWRRRDAERVKLALVK